MQQGNSRFLRRHRLANPLPGSFADDRPAVLAHFFKGKHFTGVKYESVTLGSPSLYTLADAFDMRAIPKPCGEGREVKWKSGDCTGPVLWARV
ncbi:hypothetical protein DIPPA_27652 [Diplonema papillatum]|nr:hypothetical protein DIPPA_27652 [Diplonema papillatum]